MRQHLIKNEGTAQNERDDRRKDKLRRAKGKSGRAQGVVWQNHRQDCEWRKHGQSRPRSLNLETLLVMSHATPKQTQDYNAIENDHDHCEYGVSCEAGFVG